MIKSVIFDADGTLFDSEPLRYKAAYIAVQEISGLKFLEWDEYVARYVNGSHTLSDFVIANENTLNKIKMRRTELIRKFVKDELRFMDGALELIMDLSKNGLKLAIVTSSKKVELQEYLKVLNVEKYFSVLVSADEVSKTKPDPQPFITAAKLLNLVSDQCLVIEDTEKGLNSAKLAGMQCVVVPNSYTNSSNFKAADFVIKTLRDLNFQKIRAIFY